MTHLEIHRDQVERRADLLRERLMSTIDLLDQRRHGLLNVLNVREQAQRHPAVLPMGVAGAALALSGVVAVTVRRVSTRDARLRRERLDAIWRLWQHPDRVARRERGVIFRIGRALLVSAATAALGVLARRGIQRARGALLPAAAPARPPQLLVAEPRALVPRVAEPGAIRR